MAVKEVITETTPEGKVIKTKALRLLARRLVACGLEGDVSALREIGDRLDGRAMQGIDVRMDVHIEGITRRIIDVTPEVTPTVTSLLSKDVALEPSVD